MMRCFAYLAVAAALFSSVAAGSPRMPERKDRYGRLKAPRLEPKLVHANNDFAIRLFKQVDRKAGAANTFLSPYSITTALALLYNGAAGDTREEMARTLDLRGYSLEQINQSAAALRDVLEAPESGIRVSMANGIWIKSGRSFREDFLVRVGRFFRADATEVDFSEAGAADEINDWVAEKTHDKIDYLFADGDISSAEAVLANAVWFRGRWRYGFDRAYTQDATFCIANGPAKKVPMMRRTGVLSWFHADGITGVTAPFGKGAFGFFAMIPDEGKSLSEVIAKMEIGQWYEWMSRLRVSEDEVTLSLPRFKVTQEAMLNEPLSDMGMGAAFNRRADYRPMGLDGSRLDLFKHKAALEIAEDGPLARGPRLVRSENPERISVNRPFMCAIRDNRTGAILFMGAIRDPAAEASERR